MKTTPCLYTLIAAATLAIGGNALAQAGPPTSTAGGGCTATGNAMRGGNLGGHATNTPCGPAAAVAPAIITPVPAAAAPAAPAPVAAAPAASTGMGAPAVAAETPAAPARSAPVRVAKADRN